VGVLMGGIYEYVTAEGGKSMACFWLAWSHGAGTFHASIIPARGGLFTGDIIFRPHLGALPISDQPCQQPFPQQGALSVHRQTEQTDYHYCKFIAESNKERILKIG